MMALAFANISRRILNYGTELSENVVPKLGEKDREAKPPQHEVREVIPEY